MLRRNLNVECGLVNGSIGSVVDFGMSPSQITHISVKFENLFEPVNINRESCTFEVLKCFFYSRKQFPIMLAFAITVHKAQGLSLNTAIVDAGPASFGSGMTYVALSRVTKLEGLHLVDFDKTKIVCDHNTVAEYNRLRSLYAAHIGQLDVVPATKTDDNADRSKDESSAKCCKKAARKTCNRSKTDDKADRSKDDSSAKCCKKAQRKTSKRSKTEQLHEVLQPPQRPDCEQVDIVHTGTEEHNIYQHCQVTSVGEEFMRRTCERLNLKFHESANRTQTTNSDAAVSLERELRTKTGQQINVTLHRIIGDGNCLSLPSPLH